jgi:hypothetical protein
MMQDFDAPLPTQSPAAQLNKVVPPAFTWRMFILFVRLVANKGLEGLLFEEWSRGVDETNLAPTLDWYTSYPR